MVPEAVAERIEKIADIPVISVKVSVYDILRAIKMAENYSKLYAIVGFPSLTEPAHTLCDLLAMDVDILTVHSEQEIVDTLDLLKLGGYKMIISGMHTYTIARQKGFDAFLITAGMESVYDAFNQAIAISSHFRKLQQENLFLKRIAKDRSGRRLLRGPAEKNQKNTLTPDESVTPYVFAGGCLLYLGLYRAGRRGVGPYSGK